MAEPDFDTYWRSLVHRVHHKKEVLGGAEALFYRLAYVYGETLVDGIEAYFECRFDEFEKDMAALVQCGFADLASDFREARQVIFGNAPLDAETVRQVTDRLLQEGAEVMPILEKIGVIYDRLIARLPDLAEYKYQFGIREGFYVAVDG